MTRVVKFPVTPPLKLGPKKVKRRKPDPEEFGQLNLFDQSKIISFSSDNYFEEALILDEAGNEQAVEYYLRAIENEQSLADSYCNLGIIMSNKDDKAKAIDYLTKSLKEDPRHYEAHYNLANVYSDSESYELAKMHYEVAIEIEPQFPNAHYNLGLVYISIKNYKEAILCIDRYMALSSDYENKIANELIKTLNSIAQ